MPNSLLLGNVHLALYYTHMEYGSLYPADECLTIWDVLDRWPRINLYELECLINKSDDGDPLLPPYEYERAVNMEPDDALYLHRMRRGTLKISEHNDILTEVRDESGLAVASTCYETCDEHKNPLWRDKLYFLLGDVKRLEKEHPDYVSAIPKRKRNAPAETTRRPPSKSSSAPRRTIKMLRVEEVAALLGIKKSTVWQWVADSKLPAGIRLSNKATRWYEDDILRFIEKHID
ncbi:MAG: helix-turn-helix domain-containing protein [Desulfovibrio sp.]|nr:helix-turn-helix domain-containing protein [Desulfovibrio sp.]